MIGRNITRNECRNLNQVSLSKIDLDRAVLERKAETLYNLGQYQNAVTTLQQLIDKSDQPDKGWYLQTMASYLYPVDPNKALIIQNKAYGENQRLFRPESAVMYSRLQYSSNQPSRILESIKRSETQKSLVVHVMTILDKLTFNSPPESFEEGMHEMGASLGLIADSPEKTAKIGPDNLWQLKERLYWIIECKNNVSSNKISKRETGQMNNAIGWFGTEYPDCTGEYVFVHPAEMLARDAYLTEPVSILGEEKLNELKKNIRNFYNTIETTPANDLTLDLVRQSLSEHHLTIENLSKHYLKRIERRESTK